MRASLRGMLLAFCIAKVLIRTNRSLILSRDIFGYLCLSLVYLAISTCLWYRWLYVLSFYQLYLSTFMIFYKTNSLNWDEMTPSKASNWKCFLIKGIIKIGTKWLPFDQITAFLFLWDILKKHTKRSLMIRCFVFKVTK